MSDTLLLYGTSACHLCEEAAALLRQIAPELGFSWSEIDIAEDDALTQRYAIKIPVLKQQNSAGELCWPFSHNDVLAFLLNDATN